MSDETASPSSGETLRALVLSSRRGDKVAYKTLLTHLAPLIRRSVSSRIGQWGQKHFVDDVTQDSLLAIHLKLHTYDQGQPFLAWVHAVARHKLIDHLRKLKVAIPLDDASLPELVDPRNPEDTIIARDVQKLLSQLKPPAGDIIYALKVSGASVKEIASRYKLSEGNVKVIVHRGLQKLSSLIGAR